MARTSAVRRLLDRPATLPAQGVINGRSHKRIVVACEPALFDRVNMLAGASGVSFAEAVRQLLERGLDNSVDRSRYDRALADLQARVKPRRDELAAARGPVEE